MKSVKRAISVFLCFSLILLCVGALSSCSQSKRVATVTLVGTITDSYGNPASGKIMAFYSDFGNYTAPIAQDGSFTVNGLLLDDEMVMNVEDEQGNIYTEITYLTIATANAVGLGAENGRNNYGYLNLYSTTQTKTLYADFVRVADDTIACTYLSDTQPSPQTTNAVV